MAKRTIPTSKLIGQRYGRLVIVDADPPGQDRRATCTCDCGATLNTLLRSLRAGATRSCGCLCKDVAATLVPLRCRTHGDASLSGRAPEYLIYRAMLNRCFNPNVDRYPSYGGRGITVADEWRGPGGYEAFLAHIGRRPSPRHSLDRIDSDGDYRQGNVRWATPLTQANNKTTTRLVEFRGENTALQDLARRFDLGAATLAWRLNRGWSVERAVSQPARRKVGS